MSGGGRFIGESITKIIILLFNCLGNFLVIQAIVKTQRLRTASNYLVVNLAVCDLLSPLLNIPIDISVETVGGSWQYGLFLCKLIWPLATSLTTCSALTLVAISIDRSRALRHPFVTKLSCRQAVAVIFILHGLSAAVILPYAVASVVVDGQCQEDWSNNIFTPAQYTIGIFAVQYAVPLLILAFVYGKAARYLRQSTLNLERFAPKYGGVEGRQTFFRRCRRSTISYNESESSKTTRIRGEQNARVVKMFAVVVVVFAVFTLPNNVHWLLTDFAEYSSYEHHGLVSFLCVMCTYINCLANPIIYGTLSRDYKNYFMRILSLARCKRYQQNVSTITTSTKFPSYRSTKRLLKDCHNEPNGNIDAPPPTLV